MRQEPERTKAPNSPCVTTEKTYSVFAFSSLLNCSHVSFPIALYATNVYFPHPPHTLLRAGSLLSQKMQISNKIISRKLIIEKKIASLYSFGGMCILRRVLEGNA